MKNEYLECGVARSAHGVRGLFKTEVWCDSPKVLASQKRVFTKAADGSFKEQKITSKTVAGEMVILGIEGVETREDAVAFCRTVLYLHRDDIPLKRGSFFISDILGLPVTDEKTGKILGTVKSIDEVPQGKMYTVETGKGDVLIPDLPIFIKKVDPDFGVVAAPIAGMFDDDAL